MGREGLILQKTLKQPWDTHENAGLGQLKFLQGIITCLTEILSLQKLSRNMYISKFASPNIFFVSFFFFSLYVLDSSEISDSDCDCLGPEAGLPGGSELFPPDFT